MNKPSHVVGIGASAGGLSALEALFNAMPLNTSMAFIVVQHLSPDFKSQMPELIERQTKMPVVSVYGEVEMQANTIYLMPPKHEVVVEGNRLIAYARPEHRALHLPINIFLHSLASHWGERGIGIILSGTGADGTQGCLSLSDANGVVIAQEPESAQFDNMPLSAIGTGCVDAVLKPEDIPTAIISLTSDTHGSAELRKKKHEEAASDEVEPVFAMLRDKFGTDFSHYKPTTLYRRIRRRILMQDPAPAVGDYVQLLAKDPVELELLYKDLLIGVTSFFRDPDAFESLRKSSALTNLISSLPKDGEFRVWVCGCSTGEEAYSIGIVLLEALAELKISRSLKIFATDLQTSALQIAAEGVYSEESLQAIPLQLRSKYFQETNTHEFKVSPTLRKMIIFSEHNILRNPPFTRLHLVCCRNLLIYFKNQAQLAAMTSFNFALNKNGLLFLGASETTGSLSSDFELLDRHWKIYRKVRESYMRTSSRVTPTFSRLTSYEGQRPKDDRSQPLGRLYNTLLDRFIPAGFLINENSELLHVFGEAYKYLKPPAGRVTGEIFPMLGNGLSIALSTALRNVREQPGKMTFRGVKTDSGDELLEISVDTLYDRVANANFFMVTIKPQGQPDLLQNGMQEAQEFSFSEETAEYVKQLQAELLRTREALQTNAEELETSNEELQASNEELLASNEELQSTNEELHSVNEELYTVNYEHENKILELDAMSSDLRQLVNNADAAILFLDKLFQVRVFNPKATTIFNLVEQDIGRDLRHFMPKIPDHRLTEDLQKTLSSGKNSVAYIQTQDETTPKWFKRECKLSEDHTSREHSIVLSYQEETQSFVASILNQVLMQCLDVYDLGHGFIITDQNFRILTQSNRLPDEFETWRVGTSLAGVLDHSNRSTEHRSTKDTFPAYREIEITIETKRQAGSVTQQAYTFQLTRFELEFCDAYALIRLP